MRRPVAVVLGILIGSVWAGNAQSQFPSTIPYVSSLPATCSPTSGQTRIVFKTTATIGLYQCLTTNTWTAVATASGISGTVGANQVVYGTGASSVASEAAFGYDPATNIFTVDTATIAAVGATTTLTIGGAAGVVESAAAGVLTTAGLSGTAENLTWNYSAANLVTVATGTGVTSLTFSGIDLTAPTFTVGSTTGVRESATTGVLTWTGLGGGANENLLLDFNTNADQVSFSSSTGATALVMTSLELRAPSFRVQNGGAFQTSQTIAHTGLLRAYDVDAGGYLTFATLTNANVPSFAVAAPAGGTLTLSADSYATTTNCSDSAGAAACGSAAAGTVVMDAAATTVVVSTTAVTAASEIHIQEDSSLGTRLSVTCNTTIARSYVVTARTAATSFTVTASAAPITNPACLSYRIVN